MYWSIAVSLPPYPIFKDANSFCIRNLHLKFNPHSVLKYPQFVLAFLCSRFCWLYWSIPSLYSLFCIPGFVNCIEVSPVCTHLSVFQVLSTVLKYSQLVLAFLYSRFCQLYWSIPSLYSSFCVPGFVDCIEVSPACTHLSVFQVCLTVLKYPQLVLTFLYSRFCQLYWSIPNLYSPFCIPGFVHCIEVSLVSKFCWLY